MKKVMVFCVLLVLAVSVLGCGGNSGASETETFSPQTTAEPDSGEYGVLQALVDGYGFPFELRYTEGMELTTVTVFADSAERKWLSNNDNATYDALSWSLAGNTLQITGGWNESFTLDMERGTATSLTDGAQYRLVVHIPDSIETKWYVTWDTDQGISETQE